MLTKALKITAGVVCVILFIGCVFGVYALTVTLATTSITLDTSKRYQTMQGFGASSAWTYQDLGANEDVNLKNTAMEMLYGDSGLALNTFRYNIGGGGAELELYSDKLKETESFFIADRFTGDYSAFADENNYDFTRDSATLDLFERALGAGNIDRVIFFANSPHYLMTESGKTHGKNNYDNNLKEECYEAFSKYMLIIVNRIYHDLISKYGKNIEIHVSPVNEPQWKWGGDDATQEGCHFDPKQLAKFYDTFYRELKAFNLSQGTQFKMDVFESGNYKMISSTRTKFNEYMTEFEKYGYFEDITHISLHSYGVDDSVFYKEIFADYMSKYYPNISISMSEYCSLDEGVDASIGMGIKCGKVMMRDIAILDVTDWSYRLSISKGSYEDGLVYWKENANGISSLDVTKRYYVFGQFSKYIDSGSVRISSNYSDFLGVNGVECVAFKNPDDSITVVALNDSDKSRRIKLKGISGYSRVKEVLTDCDVNWQTREYDFDGRVKAPSKSISTFILTR